MCLLLYIIGKYVPHIITRRQLFTHLAYVIRPDGVSGILLCTSLFAGPYVAVKTLAFRYPTRHATNGSPVMTWPPSPTTFRHTYSIRLSTAIAKCVTFRFHDTTFYLLSQIHKTTWSLFSVNHNDSKCSFT